MNSLMFLGLVMFIFYSVALWFFSIKPIIDNRHQPITEQEIKEYNKHVRKGRKTE
jgi:hypothetical protein